MQISVRQGYAWRVFRKGLIVKIEVIYHQDNLYALPTIGLVDTSWALTEKGARRRAQRIANRLASGKKDWSNWAKVLIASITVAGVIAGAWIKANY